ncbi:MAG TPA: rhomboid family intramembrane serine protease [Terriglobales bacterium]|nr:rhomboid family intramembrane serine protease [Terriglobales bacterium]
MAHCKSCGRELPSFSVGREPDFCPECHAMMAAQRAATPRPAVAPRPPVTTALVGLNVLVFLAMLFSGASLLAPTYQQLLQWGADFGPLSLNGQPWRILASNYVHIGIIHIGLNMWCLWNLGFLAERIFEPWTYVLTYTACGIAGSLASLWIHPLGVGAGASGAIFGLAGALIAALYLGHLPVPKAAIKGTLKSLLSFAGYNLFFGAVVPGIDNSAHIGGLITGLAIGALLSKHLRTSREERNRWRRLVFIGVAIVLLGAGTYVKKKNGGVTPPTDAPESHNQDGMGTREETKCEARGTRHWVLGTRF